ncbi:FAD-dependent monooxygenase [Pseudonocardia sp. ICBG1293]|uniref:FAD-dependent monooxygenase n=1 Tax=Pseudonocardia sp. ICBG1293 TaxID=2844382 RepID=UPI001CCFB73A|nr:FAD-dependent monooxygenase [Pseudonocardia sp. ICBG1293]
MTPSRHVLVSGAGIAGTALALRLSAYGWRTTVLERAPRRRDEGHNIDVRGAAREVLRRMGLEDAVRAAGTREVGFRVIGDGGRPVGEIPMDPSGPTDGPTAELEILRGELARVLMEAAPESTTFRFGTRIVDVEDRGTGDGPARVALDDGTTVTADLVVVAEGLRSRTRDLLFDDVTVRETGMYGAYLTIPRTGDDDAWWNWFHETGSRGVHLRPDNLGTTRAMLTFLSGVRGLETLGDADVRTVLRHTFADAGWAAPRILRELGDGPDGAPMYFDAVGQVMAPRWSSGRVVLLGDAAHCPSPLGGGGTSLALIGAYVLAGELATRPADTAGALHRYEQLLRSAVGRAQKLPPLTLTNPRTRTGIRTLRTTFRAVASSPGQRLLGLFGGSPTGAVDAFRLPDYPAPSSSRVETTSRR